MLIEAKTLDFAALLRGEAPAPYRLCDSPLAPPEVLAMLSELADRIRPIFSPAAWMIIEDDEIVGLISPTQLLDAADRSLRIGYGVAPTRQGRGAATRAVRDLAAWAVADERVRALTAETSVDNPASQTVLARNGFQAVGERVDSEDGPLILWRLDL
ncbi:GNAT family N-acetyltransferase [Caulobacter sp. RL271]|jgi:RimJ/RimL family protein N-acetyltransferase|uniref:GNAT family N-acetyltransferase n=1 Tax=Caulobacter segnis TaxID=88688 RepID=A0ABY4ZVI1_9CAUL|nr:GNAT family protein [Caulobacter segnis]USQ96751.1 GNAT family N-acetyltransferase [Caulobacter segnis]